MRPRHIREGMRPGIFKIPGKEPNFTFQQKLEYIKAARAKKIEAIEAKRGSPLTAEEREAVTLTINEYDEHRDQQNSLSGNSIQNQHTWNHALKEAGIPLAHKQKESYQTREDIYLQINDFKNKFIKEQGRDPKFPDYQKAVATGDVPSQSAIKRHTHSRSLGELLVQMGILITQDVGRHTFKT